MLMPRKTFHPFEEFYAYVCSFEAMLMDKYCGDEYRHNRDTYAGGDDCIFPSPK
jgi:hypothetical protein